jgi:hypothetical protein
MVRMNYETPACEIMEIVQEGVLCGSGDYGFGNSDFGDDGIIEWN